MRRDRITPAGMFLRPPASRPDDKETPAMISEPVPPHPTIATGANGWREIIQSGAEGSGSDGVTLEHLIDLQRAHARRANDTR
jgi:hypothetical protein